jgi:hypothetical protein
MALGLMVFSSMIALPVAAAAWLLGYASIGQAALAYMGIGWAIMALGALAWAPGFTPRPQPVKTHRPRSIVVDVTVADGR